MKKKKIDKSSAIYPPEWEKADAKAIQQCIAGEATPEQQRRAMDWIIKRAAATYDFPFRPGGQDGERESNIAMGRMFVGQQIVKLSKVDLAAMAQNEQRVKNQS